MRTLYRILPELQPCPIGPEQVIESIGIGTRRIEDVTSTTDGTTLYAVGEGFLFTIDRRTGVQTDIATLGFSALGITFNDEGDLLAADGLDLVEMDPARDGTTFLCTMPNATTSNDLSGLLFQPQVPASSPQVSLVVLLILISIGVVSLQRRRVAQSEMARM